MNPSLRLPKERVAVLEPSDVERYLRDHGWEEDPSLSSPGVGGFRLRSDRRAEVLVPRGRRFGDYALRVGDVLQTLAAVERRTAWEVLEDLTIRRLNGSPYSPENRHPSRGDSRHRRRDDATGT